MNFKLGDCENTYKSSTSDAYNFNKQKAEEARGSLDIKQLKEIKSTHYALGSYRDDFNTSTSVTYKPQSLVKSTMNKGEAEGKKTNIDFSASGNDEDRKRSMYREEYTPKKIEN